MLRELLGDQPDWLITILLVVIAFVIIFILRRIVTAIIVRPLRRIANRRESQLGLLIVDALVPTIRLLLTAAGLLIAVAILTPPDSSADFLNKIIRSLIIVTPFIAIYQLVDAIAESSAQISGLLGWEIDTRLVPLIRSVLKTLVLIIALLTIMNEWDVDVTAFITSLGIFGLAISFAAQDTIANIFAFTTIAGDKPFAIGDFVRTPDVEGRVKHIGMRSTRLVKPDGIVVTVPNSVIANGPVESFDLPQLDFSIGVTYDTTADQLDTLVNRLRDMLDTHDDIASDSIAVHFASFGDSALMIEVNCDVIPIEYLEYIQAKQSIFLDIMRVVDELGLSMAFPTQSIHVESMPS